VTRATDTESVRRVAREKKHWKLCDGEFYPEVTSGEFTGDFEDELEFTRFVEADLRQDGSILLDSHYCVD
jgi:hypothetical protein